MYRDIVEVVRCKDCKHGTESRLYINPYLVCKRTERPMLGEDWSMAMLKMFDEIIDNLVRI